MAFGIVGGVPDGAMGSGAVCFGGHQRTDPYCLNRGGSSSHPGLVSSHCTWVEGTLNGRRFCQVCCFAEIEIHE